MGFKCGIVGLPNVGKSTIFNALTKAGIPSENFPFCTIEPNKGIVVVPDERLDYLKNFFTTDITVPATMEFVDIAGLVKGASKGEGLGNKFLGHIKETDAIAHVVRCFDNDDIMHVEGNLDPIRDIEIIDTELILADSETVDNNLQRYKKRAKAGGKEVLLAIKMLDDLMAHLQQLQPARTFDLESHVKELDETKFVYRDLQLITHKPVLYVCNVEESLAHGEEDNAYTTKVKEFAKKQNAYVIIVSGRIEEELIDLDDAEKQEMLQAIGCKEPGLNRLIRRGYELLGLQTYITAGKKEVRAWTIPHNCTARKAAGVIHSDFERGFICAEVYHYDDLKALQSMAKLKEKGLIRTEGRDYIVKDGDVMDFRFNV